MSARIPASDSLVAPLALAGAVVFWGTSFVATKIALTALTPLIVIWLRMVVASLVFAPFWARVPRPTTRAGDWRWLLGITICIPGLYYLCEGYAVRYTTSGQAGVVSAILPLLVGAAAWLWLGERLSPRWGGAIALSLVGVALLSLTGTSTEAAPDPVLGNLLELGAMVSAAVSMVGVKRLSDRYPPWFLTGLQAAVGVVFFAPAVFVDGFDQLARVPLLVWGCIVYLGVAVSLGAFGLYNLALSRLPAGRAALAINLVPVVALFAGWLVRGEALTAAQLLGAGLIVAAVVAVEFRPTR